MCATIVHVMRGMKNNSIFKLVCNIGVQKKEQPVQNGDGGGQWQRVPVGMVI